MPIRRQQKIGASDLSQKLRFHFGGDEGDRTPYLLHAMQALSQVSYTPKLCCALATFDIIAKAMVFVNRKF